MNTKLCTLLVGAAVVTGSVRMNAQTAQTAQAVQHSVAAADTKTDTHLDCRIRHLEQVLLLDDATAERFRSLYREYQEELAKCRPAAAECDRLPHHGQHPGMKAGERKHEAGERKLAVGERKHEAGVHRRASADRKADAADRPGRKERVRGERAGRPEAGAVKQAAAAEHPQEPVCRMTDEERRQAVLDRLEARQQCLAVQQKYAEKFSEILTARQLEQLFAPGRRAHIGR